MKDWNKEARADWIVELSDPYKERRDGAVEFLRRSNRYCLDKHSRPYRPSNGHTHTSDGSVEDAAMTHETIFGKLGGAAKQEPAAQQGNGSVTSETPETDEIWRSYKWASNDQETLNKFRDIERRLRAAELLLCVRKGDLHCETVRAEVAERSLNLRQKK